MAEDQNCLTSLVEISVSNVTKIFGAVRGMCGKVH
jgi:hypothetical protein